MRQVSQTDSGEPHLDTKHQGDFNPPATASLYRDLLTKANYQAEHHPANAATGPGNKIGEILYSREAPGIIDLSKGPDNIWKVVPTLEPFQVIPITILMSLFGGSAKQVLNDAGIKIPRLIEKNNLAQGLLAVRHLAHGDIIREADRLLPRTDPYRKDELRESPVDSLNMSGFDIRQMSDEYQRRLEEEKSKKASRKENREKERYSESDQRDIATWVAEQTIRSNPKYI